MDFDIENTALGDTANELKRFQAIAILEGEDPGLVVSLTFWSFNRDQPCPAGAVEPWAPGTCSNVSQNPYDFTKIVAQYAG